MFNEERVRIGKHIQEQGNWWFCSIVIVVEMNIGLDESSLSLICYLCAVVVWFGEMQMMK